MTRRTLLVAAVWLANLLSQAASPDPARYDIVVYGGTSAGVIAAVQADRLGKRVALVSPDRHLGGMTTSGLGWTDAGNTAGVGGLAREFYHRVWQAYRDPAAWRQQKRAEFANRGQGTPAMDDRREVMWTFEPHVAERVFEELLAETGVDVRRDAWLDRESGVDARQGRIHSIRTLDGALYEADVFLDATYEGDLLAAAGVTYHVGREARTVYGEQWNGVQTGVFHHPHHFFTPVDPYATPGDPASGLLPGVSPDPPGEPHAGDHRVQAYCFRLCMTRVPENRVAFPKPEGYDPARYELLARALNASAEHRYFSPDPVPNRKTDTNNMGPVSTDHLGANDDYPEASYERRRQIVEDHRRYQQGLLYFLANDPSVPARVREDVSRWGLAADEFVDNANWPHQLYVREARRMVGAYVMTEQDCLGQRDTPDSVGLGSYVMDSHNVQRYVTPEGHAQNEGDIGVRPPGPYRVPYGALTPRRGECRNLLVPVALSASHIAYGSIRMEPVFMILGQSAATAAALAIDERVVVQDAPYPQLRERLLADGQVLEAP